MVSNFFVPSTAADTQACYSIGFAKWCLVAAETGPIHTRFGKAFKHTHLFLKKVRNVLCAFSDWRPQSREAIIKKHRNKRGMKSQLINIAHTFAPCSNILWNLSKKMKFFMDFYYSLTEQPVMKSSHGIKCHPKCKFHTVSGKGRWKTVLGQKNNKQT